MLFELAFRWDLTLLDIDTTSSVPLGYHDCIALTKLVEGGTKLVLGC